MNITLLKKSLDAIAQEPSRWDQTKWVDNDKEPCGTTLCLGGHALLQSGQYVLGTNNIVHNSFDPWNKTIYNDVVKATDFWSIDERDFLDNILRKSGYEGDNTVQSRAAKLLEMDEKDAIQLFHTMSGIQTRNPDAFRCYVVQTLLAHKVINNDEAIELLDLHNAYVQAEVEDPHQYAENEPPF